MENLPDCLHKARSITVLKSHMTQTAPIDQFLTLSCRAGNDGEICFWLFKKGNICCSRPPSGTYLILVRQKEKIRGCIDYCALNHRTKLKSTPMAGPEKIFDRSDKAMNFFKLELKSAFHEIRVSPPDIKQITCNTKYDHFKFSVMSTTL